VQELLEQEFIMKKKIVIHLVLCFICFSYLGAAENAAKKSKIEKDQPIEIVSDRLDAYNEKKLVVFSGNAVATQGDRVIKSDRLLLYYKKDQQGQEKRVSKDVVDNTGDLEKIEAKGHVIVTEGERIVTGNDAVYYQDTQQIIMTGNPVMREGRNVIHGDKIVVYLNEDRGVVESAEKKRVKATIYPEDRKKRKKDEPK
jgi:lipopolysaccharide export system protein LptA